MIIKILSLEIIERKEEGYICVPKFLQLKIVVTTRTMQWEMEIWIY